MLAKTVYSQAFSMEKVLIRIRQLKNNAENHAFQKELGYIKDGYDCQIEMMENMIEKLYEEVKNMITTI